MKHLKVFAIAFVLAFAILALAFRADAQPANAAPTLRERVYSADFLHASGFKVTCNDACSIPAKLKRYTGIMCLFGGCPPCRPCSADLKTWEIGRFYFQPWSDFDLSYTMPPLPASTAPGCDENRGPVQVYNLGLSNELVLFRCRNGGYVFPFFSVADADNWLATLPPSPAPVIR